MKIVVIGKGGREHALVDTLLRSEGHLTAPAVYCWPGSDAIAEQALIPPVSCLDSLVEWMSSEKVDLCVAGEESCLVQGEGIAASCQKAGIPCWGPIKAAAQLEASKAFAKEFLFRHGIPTATYVVAEDLESARKAITSYPVVLKFDGLAAGKGVAVCLDQAAAEEFLNVIFVERQFGEGKLVIEECLTGPEVSIMVSVSGPNYQLFIPARDYKRVGDGDAGPNTGGMGAVASSQLISQEVMAQIERDIVRPSVEGLQKDALHYQGFLYCGLMLTPNGPKVIEYNCRFGDPEAEAVMPMLEGDFAGYLLSGAQGQLNPSLIRFQPGWSVCLVLASENYPSAPVTGDLISGLEQVQNAQVYHAGTKRQEAGYVTQGGRVLNVVCQGVTREEAREAVYREAAKVQWRGCQRRSDIATLHFE